LVTYLSGFIFFELGLLTFWLVLDFYTVMIAGWCFNSGYSLLGGPVLWLILFIMVLN